eukprot:gb/GEZN01011341.1/.p1 GENE.gb/GEZN01011341.1/~~gb/GEZN01011341.1/.p1  ORF type:complete len:255 (+),score=32.17 gb/GEZN01011341.1/:108-872(+)
MPTHPARLNKVDAALLRLNLASLREMKLLDLKGLCKEFDIPGVNHKTKGKLICMILNARHKLENDQFTASGAAGTPKKISFPKSKKQLEERHYICRSNPPLRRLSALDLRQLEQEENCIYVDKRTKQIIDCKSDSDDDCLDPDEVVSVITIGDCSGSDTQSDSSPDSSPRSSPDASPCSSPEKSSDTDKRKHFSEAEGDPPPVDSLSQENKKSANRKRRKRRNRRSSDTGTNASPSGNANKNLFADPSPSVCVA